MIYTRPKLTSLALAIVALDLSLKLITDFGLALNSRQPLLIYIGMVGVYFVLAPLLIVATLFMRIRVPATEVRSVRRCVIFLLAATVYFVAWIPVGLMLGQHPLDVFGSTARVLLPFLTALIVGLAITKASIENAGAYYRVLAKVVIAVTVLAAALKVVLVSQGQLYGAGLHQFRIGGFVAALLVIAGFRRVEVSWSRPLTLSLLCGLCILTVLSLKRGAWLELALALGFVGFAFPPRQLAKPVLLALALGVGFSVVLVRWGVMDDVLGRVEYTFSGSGSGVRSLDNSSYTRVAEVRAALYTLQSTGFFGVWLTGRGPGAGYENPYGFRFRNFNEAGEPYHIHSAIGIVGYRYGLIGLAFHLVPLGAAAIWFLRLSFRLRRVQVVSASLMVGFAATVGMLAALPYLFTGNVFFAQLMYGVYLATAYSAYRLIHIRSDLARGQV